VQIDSRIIPPPELVYGDKLIVRPGDRGAWNLRNTRLLQCPPINSWAVAAFDRQSNCERDLQVGSVCLPASVPACARAFGLCRAFHRQAGNFLPVGMGPVIAVAADASAVGCDRNQ
jgi:Mid domain of argonaute